MKRANADTQTIEAGKTNEIKRYLIHTGMTTTARLDDAESALTNAGGCLTVTLTV